jgi:hypothetical protein
MLDMFVVDRRNHRRLVSLPLTRVVTMAEAESGPC